MSKVNDVVEALVEMHFHAALIEKFSKRYGKSAVNLYKPSQSQERLVGFDSAFQIGPKVTREDFINVVTQEIKSGSRTSLYLTYFLQFKVVERMDGFGARPSSAVTKVLKTATGGVLPYYRSELDLRVPKAGSPNQLSQHQTLVALSRLPRANVRYACGMLFDLDKLWETPDLADLRFVPVRHHAGHASYKAGDRHFILFETPASNPIWCSEPEEGESQTVDQWMAEIPAISAQELLPALQNSESALFESTRRNSEGTKFQSALRILHLSSEARIGQLPETARNR